MIASMAEVFSRMAVVLPQGALFRKSAEGKIREALLKEDLIEAVIGMAPTFFMAPASPAAWLSSAGTNQPSGRTRCSSSMRKPLPKRPRSELPRPRTRRTDRRYSRPSKMSKIGPRSSARRDQGRRLDAQYLPLRPAAHRRTSRRCPRRWLPSKTHSPKHAPPKTTCEPFTEEDGPMTERLSQKELESYLWGAATLLRGLIDASDYKQYIFPLLFFKRLSDVWEGDYKKPSKTLRTRAPQPPTTASPFPRCTLERCP